MIANDCRCIGTVNITPYQEWLLLNGRRDKLTVSECECACVQRHGEICIHTHGWVNTHIYPKHIYIPIRYCKSVQIKSRAWTADIYSHLPTNESTYASNLYGIYHPLSFHIDKKTDQLRDYSFSKQTHRYRQTWVIFNLYQKPSRLV